VGNLQILKGIASGVQYICLYIHPKSDEKVEYDGRSHRHQRNIDKILADGSGSYPHFFTDIGAHTKKVPFNKMPEAIHAANLK
jgi:hypothetical protein